MLGEERSAGRTLGWSALVPPCPFTPLAAAQLETEVMAIPRDALTRKFVRLPKAGCAVILNVASVIGERLQLFQAMRLRDIRRVVELRLA